MNFTLSAFTKNTVTPTTRLLLLLPMIFWATGSLFAQTNWTGSVSTNWNTAGNWSAGIPDANDDVTIPNVTNDPVISAAGAVAKSVTVQSGGVLTLTAAGVLTINGAATQGILNQGTVQNSGIIHIGNVSGVGESGLYNEGVFNNNTGAQLHIDRSNNQGVFNRSNGVFTNHAILNIGGLASVGSSGINNASPAIFNNNTGGQLTIDRCWNVCLSLHDGTFNNSGSIVLAPLNGSNAAINTGIGIIYGAFNNNTGGQISIERCRDAGVELSYPICSFSNAGTVTINTPSIDQDLIHAEFDDGTFTNHTGGVVKGTGNINGGVFVNAGGTLIPGYSPGMMTFTASENFTNSILPIEVNGTGTPGVNYDQIVVNGTATLGGTLTLSINYTPSNGDEVTIVSAAAILGTFSSVTGLSAGWSISYAGDKVVLVYGANFWTGSISTNWSTPGNWSLGVVPAANHPVIIPNVANDPVISSAGAVARSIWVQNSGLLTISSAGTLAINGSTTQGLLNQGTVQNSGTLNIGNTASTGVNGIANGGIFNNNTGGQIHIDRCSSAGVYTYASTFSNAGALTIGALSAVTNLLFGTGVAGTFSNNTGGIVKGTGNIDAFHFVHAGGTLSPGYSPGKMTFTGNENFTNSILPMEVNGTGMAGVNFDQIVVNGTATLGGTLALSVNYTGANGDGIILLGANAISGTFSSVTGLPANWHVNYSSTEVTLTYIATAASTWTGNVSTAWNTAGNWSAGVPNAFTSVTIPNRANDPVISTAGAAARSITVQSGGVLTLTAAGTLAINGAVDYGLLNQGTVQNNGIIHIGNVSAVGNNGLVNENVFNNNTGAQLHIDRSANQALGNNSAGVFTNHGILNIGGLAASGGFGIDNTYPAIFNNHSSGQITIDRCWYACLSVHDGTFNNSGNIVLAPLNGSSTAIDIGISIIYGTFNNNTGGQISIERCRDAGVQLSYPICSFSNAGTLTVTTPSVDKHLIKSGFDDGTFTNHTGGAVKGTGNINGVAFVNAGGTLIPGYSPGKMTFTASENFSNNTLAIEVNGTGTPGVNYDQIVVNGTATLGGTLALSINYTPFNGDEVIIVSASSISGTFPTVTGLPANWQIIYTTTKVKLYYCATTPISTPPVTTNNGLHFDGTNDFVQINNTCPPAPFINGGNAITIEYWFQGLYIQSAVRLQSTTDTFIVAGWNGKHIVSNDDGTNGLPIGMGYNDGAWHHVAMTWQRNTPNGFKSYLDGQLVAQRNSANTPLPVISSGLCLGAYGGTAEFMLGALDEVRIWNVARTQADIQSGMSALTLPQTGLMVYYKFNHGTAAGANSGINTIANSANANAFTGVLRNFALSGISSNWIAGSTSVPVWYRDQDGDTFGDPGVFQQIAQQPAGYVADNTDCDDNDPLEKPGQVWYKDTDNDGYGQTGAATITQCLRPTGYKVASELINTTGDCNDNNAAIKPGATEICDGVDNDCDNQTDEAGGTIWYRDVDNDGFGNAAVTQTACNQPTGYVANNTDCDDNDALEKPGQVWYKDTDNDGYGQTGAATITQCLRPTGYKVASELTNTTGDCNDNNAAIKPGATEICDGVDNDCDNQTDEGVLITYYRDMDSDGFGNPAVPQQACSQPAGYVSNNTDCDDNDALEKPGQIWYKDSDNDGYGQTGAATITQCLRPTGYKVASELTSTTGDCNDNNAAIKPGATEICDGVDNDCDNEIDETGFTTWYRDMDNDGFGNAVLTQLACTQPTGYVADNTDCDDNDALEKPGQVWYDDTDNDGYGQTGASSITQCLRPAGYKAASELTATTGDCNDGNAAINPGATEVCDGVDNNCNSQTDEGVQTTYYRDQDNDGFGNPAVTQMACSVPMGYVANNTDCNDNSALEKPGQVWYKDTDGDGYAQTGAATITQCLRPIGYKIASELISTTGDCNDNAAAVNPAATEICDGVDNDCDMQIDESGMATWYRDMDNDGFGNAALTQLACTQPTGYVADNTDCDDNDALEKPGQVWYDDTDNDGYGQTGASSITQCLRPAGYKAASELTATTGDCNDGNAAINPGATEVCDGVDNNCNSQTDEGVQTTYYRDQDNDGFGNPSVTQMACSQPTGYVTNNTDCNDSDALEKPGQVWYKDTDNDGYAQTGAATITQCLRAAGYKIASELISTNGDCNDNAAAINPAATEICDGVDNNCNDSIDESGITYYRDQDGDGYGNPAVTEFACAVPSGYVTNNTDCNDNSALEKPGQVWYKDTDNDGYGQTGATSITQCLRPTGYKVASELTSTTGDCNDASAAVNPAATEVCDDIDNNCNSEVDEATAIGGSWTNGDVGSSGTNGSAENACGTSNSSVVNVSANGFSTPSSDNLHLVYQTLCGNGEIIARVVNVSNGGWVGITLRESLASGSKKVALKTQGTNTIRREIRSATNGPASILNVNRPQHVWLRLVRNGNTFTGYTSVNGLAWDFAFAANVSMAGCIYAGLFAESINASVTTTAIFDNVQIIGNTNPLIQAPQTSVANAQQPALEVYPNPTTGAVIIDLSAYTDPIGKVRVFDAFGKLVSQVKLDGSPLFRMKIDGADGVYILSIEVEGEAPITKRVVIAH